MIERLSDKINVDLFAIAGGGSWRGFVRYPKTDAQWLKQRCGYYFSKYLSKERQKQVDERVAHVKSPPYPSAWWGANRELRAAIKDATTVLSTTPMSIEKAEHLYRSLGDTCRILDCKGFRWRHKMSTWNCTTAVFPKYEDFEEIASELIKAFEMLSSRSGIRDYVRPIEEIPDIMQRGLLWWKRYINVQQLNAA